MGKKQSNPPPPDGVIRPPPPSSPPKKLIVHKTASVGWTERLHIPPTSRAKCFLVALADICQEYDATFFYTRDDDGIHITVDDEEVFCGFAEIDLPAVLRSTAWLLPNP